MEPYLHKNLEINKKMLAFPVKVDQDLMDLIERLYHHSKLPWLPSIISYASMIGFGNTGWQQTENAC